MEQLTIYDFIEKNFKSFSQLKKDLKVGVKVKTIINTIKPEYNNEIRTISIVKTNSIAFSCIRNNKETNSYLWWQKAKNYEYFDNTFRVYDDNKQLLFEYEILNKSTYEPKTKGIQKLFGVLAANNLI